MRLVLRVGVVELTDAAPEWRQARGGILPERDAIGNRMRLAELNASHCDHGERGDDGGADRRGAAEAPQRKNRYGADRDKHRAIARQ